MLGLWSQTRRLVLSPAQMLCTCFLYTETPSFRRQAGKIQEAPESYKDLKALLRCYTNSNKCWREETPVGLPSSSESSKSAGFIFVSCLSCKSRLSGDAGASESPTLLEGILINQFILQVTFGCNCFFGLLLSLI